MNQELQDIAVGDEIHELIERLYPICRSITGEGLRESLRIVGEIIPLEIKEVPSGTEVFDWVVPEEWNVRDAFVKDASGSRVIDFNRSNLHLVGYSVPVRTRMSLSELRDHLHTLPDRPDWIPFRTSYYQPSWGFCLSHRALESLPEGEYQVEIDSSLRAGSLSYGEVYLPGEEGDEVLISTHACHPSLCNDNLSGVAVATFLARHLSSIPRRLSYRFLFLPGTIGAITWLALNEDRVTQIKHGMVLSCLGDEGKFTYKRSRKGNCPVDRAAAHTLSLPGQDFEIRDFSPYGYDERQYCSPGFDLPVGSLTRTPWGEFPEYHTSGDNPSFVRPQALEESLNACRAILNVLDGNVKFRNTSPKCEPRLGPRGLWEGSGERGKPSASDLAVLWVLNLSDGTCDLLDISERSGMPFSTIWDAAKKLRNEGLLEPVTE